MATSRALQLVNKSIDCMVSAIELYNKPDFKYREEIFSVMATNAWELLLKAKILKDANNNLNSIFVKEYPLNKNGQKSKKWKYKENHAKNKITLDIFGSLGKLKSRGIINDVCYENIELLVEIRDNAVHFYNKDLFLAQKIQEVGMATIKSYLSLTQEWFQVTLEKYNFYLMPLSFFHASKMEPIVLGSGDTAINNLLKFIEQKEKRFPSNPESIHNVTIAIETRVVKSSKQDAQSIRIASDPNAPEFVIKFEDILKTHPIDYNELTNKLKARYSDFKINAKYHSTRRKLEKDQRFCLRHPLNPQRPEKGTKQFYSPAIFNEFDKIYTKNKNSA